MRQLIQTQAPTKMKRPQAIMQTKNFRWIKKKVQTDSKANMSVKQVIMKMTNEMTSYNMLRD
jgi:hypothetical protein